MLRPLRFSCVPGCTDCCEKTGFVYLTETDSKRAAAFLGISVRAFEKHYVYRTRHLRRLRKPRHSQCPFLTAAGCAIHPVKPLQCRTYPFWPELLEDHKAWQGEASSCRGIGRGGLVRIETALRIAADMREGYPGMYD